MQKASALQLRPKMGAMIEKQKKSGEPILLEKDRVPVGVIISIEDYARFVDVDADIARREMIAEIKADRMKLPKESSSLELVRSLRTGDLE